MKGLHMVDGVLLGIDFAIDVQWCTGSCCSWLVSIHTEGLFTGPSPI